MGLGGVETGCETEIAVDKGAPGGGRVAPGQFGTGWSRLVRRRATRRRHAATGLGGCRLVQRIGRDVQDCLEEGVSDAVWQSRSSVVGRSTARGVSSEKRGVGNPRLDGGDRSRRDFPADQSRDRHHAGAASTSPAARPTRGRDSASPTSATCSATVTTTTCRCADRHHLQRQPRCRVERRPPRLTSSSDRVRPTARASATGSPSRIRTSASAI